MSWRGRFGACPVERQRFRSRGFERCRSICRWNFFIGNSTRWKLECYTCSSASGCISSATCRNFELRSSTTAAAGASARS